MSVTREPAFRLTDFEPRLDTFREDFRSGLRRRPKRLSPKYFYDAAGSRLFDRICELEEYFPARVEKRILGKHLGEICRLLGPRCRLVEFGSGSSDKTRFLLDRLADPVAYVPVDISRNHLVRAARQLAGLYPRVEMLPVCADYTSFYETPSSSRPCRRTVFFFPGSTLGNFDPEEGLRFLRGVAEQASPGDGLLIGIALQTDRRVLERAYNDAAGVTAAFNLNLLRRARNELGASIDRNSFAHEAVYDEPRARIEMRLVSLFNQFVALDGERFPFERGEHLVTEYSHKFTDAGFLDTAGRAGFRARKHWSDASRRFSVHYLTRSDEEAPAADP